MTPKDELIDDYGYHKEIYYKSYQMMGRLLDKEFIKREIIKQNFSDVYIYGGGYLGLQLYQTMGTFVNILSIVDKSGKLLIDIKDIPVIDISVLRNQYKKQPIIVTPIKFYREIYHELINFVPRDKIIFLEQFGGR